MKELTKEQYDYLKQFDNRFITATKSDYCRNVQKKDVIKIKEIYEYIIEQEYRVNPSCGTCILNLIRKVAPIYFGYEESKINKDKEDSGIIESERPKKRNSRISKK